jgi:DNA-binding beta-propeller fold protein YncE
VPSLKFGATALSVVLLLLLTACSGGGPSSQQTVSNIRPRAFVSNAGASIVQIVNAATDVLDLANSINVGTTPGLMALAPNRSLTLVFNSLSNNVSVVNNTQEAQTATISIPSWTESMAVSPDGALGYVAMPAATVLGHPAGIVDVLDLLNNSVKFTLDLPQAHRLFLNHSGNRLLVLSDNSDSVTVINPNQIGKGAYSTTVTGFDRPVWAVFTDDDSTAYVLNCGLECGGSNAGVTVLNMNSNTAGATVGLSGATAGLLFGSNLYVAGSGQGVGRLQVVNTASLVASPPVSISNGYHDRMELGSDNKLFVGAHGCSTRGCLSIFDISAKTAVVDTPSGDVTGIAPIAGRNVVYVVEGGELRIFDTKTSAPSTTQFVDIVGQAVDVKEVDAPQ